MATPAEQIQLTIEDKTAYEGGYYPNTETVGSISEAIANGKFHVRQISKAENDFGRYSLKFLITVAHSSQANVITMFDTLLKMNTMSGNATYGYTPVSAGYPYCIRFYGQIDWSTLNNFQGTIECQAWWSV
jgi:hypothetical protein